MEGNIVSIRDPYRCCDEVCTHDLAGGVLVIDLLSGDGPHPPDAHPLPVFRSLPVPVRRTGAPVPAAG